MMARTISPADALRTDIRKAALEMYRRLSDMRSLVPSDRPEEVQKIREAINEAQAALAELHDLMM